MTTIACLRIAGVPMLFGDLLVSSVTAPTVELSLPAVGTIRSRGATPRERYPSGLQQKVCIVNNDLMVAWAGTLAGARSVIKGLREKFAATPVTWKALDGVFREFGVYSLKDEFVGLFAENGVLASFGINTGNYDDPLLGECHFGGSGAGRLIMAAESIAMEMRTVGTVRDGDVAVTSSLKFASEFLLEELLAGLQDTHFGGGFEIGALTQNGAEKVGDVLILFWECSSASKNPLLMPVIIKWDYIGDDLVIQRLRQEKKSAEGYALSEHVISVITAPDREPVDRRPTPPDLNCRFLCSCYFTFVNHNTIRRTSSVFHAQQKNGPMRFTYENDHLQLAFDRKHFDQEWEWAKSVLFVDTEN